MPTFYSCSTTVELSVANLASATTTKAENKQCPESTQSITNISKAIAKESKNGTLGEIALTGDDGRQVQFLGKYQDMPFFVSRAGKGFFAPETERRTKRPAKSVKVQISDKPYLYDSAAGEVDDVDETLDLSALEHDATFENPNTPNHLPMATDQRQQHRHLQKIPSLKHHYHRSPTPPTPQALSLNIFLSSKSFSHMVYEKGRKKTIRNDVKIDVYLNGQLLESRCITYSHFHTGGTRGMKARIVRITGHRILRMVEKPLIFVPPTRSQHGSLRLHPHSDAEIDGGLNQRWRMVADALRKEADTFGQNEYGDRPIIGEYLNSLASVPVPAELDASDMLSATKPGILDVVVIWGTGRKDDPNATYIVEPTRIRVPRLGSQSSEDSTRLSAQPSPMRTPARVPAPASTSSLRPLTRAEALASALTLDGSSDEPPKAASRRALTTPLPPHPQNTPPLTNPPSSHQRSRAPSLTSQTSQTSQTKPRKHRMQYHTVLDTKQTIEEQIHSITAQAMEEAIAVRASLAQASQLQSSMADEAFDSSPLSSIPPEEEVDLVETPQVTRKIVSLKMSPAMLRESTTTPGARIQPATTRANKRIVSEPPNYVDPFGNNPQMNGFPTPTTAFNFSLSGRSGVDSTAAPSRRPGVETTPAPIPRPSQVTKRDSESPEVPLSGSRTQPKPPHGRTFPEKAMVGNEAFDAHFVLPELSRDCAITFAEKGMVRSVPAARGGTFEERGVVMGVRFIVG